MVFVSKVDDRRKMVAFGCFFSLSWCSFWLALSTLGLQKVVELQVDRVGVVMGRKRGLTQKMMISMQLGLESIFFGRSMLCLLIAISPCHHQSQSKVNRLFLRSSSRRRIK